MKKTMVFILALVAAAVMGCSKTPQQAKDQGPVIKDGSKVVMDYVLAINDKVVDSSKVNGPLHYIQGGGTLIKGLEQKLEGMRVGEERTIVVPARQAYGEFHKEAVKAVPKDVLPDDFTFEVGQIVQLAGNNDEKIPVRVVKVEKDRVIFDFNHPLAGQDLQYRVKILDIK